jgi:membrane protease YdiL (CAAX protease family)
MVRSDLIMEVRGYLVNPAERRLRAPWRLVIWLFLGGFGAIVVGAAGTAIPLPAGDGVAAALYNMGRLVGLITAVVAVTLGIGWLLDRRTLADYGLGLDGQWWRDAGFGIALGFGLPTLVLAVQLAVGYTSVTGVLPTSASDTFQFGTAGPLVRLALLMLFFVVQASAEEILVRGYLLTNLAEGGAGLLGTWRSVVVATVGTGVLFGVLHMTNPGATVLSVSNITLYGILLGACYVLTGRLGIACGFHVAWNYTLALWDFPVSGLETGVALVATESTGPDLVTGGSFGPEGGLVALPLLAVGTVALGWWVRREYGEVTILDSIAVPDLRVATRGGQG